MDYLSERPSTQVLLKLCHGVLFTTCQQKFQKQFYILEGKYIYACIQREMNLLEDRDGLDSVKVNIVCLNKTL